MAAPAGDGFPASVLEIQRYVTRLKPLLRLWNETFEQRTLVAYWIVIPRLFAIIRHAGEMDMPAGLRLNHRTLLDALARVMEAYLEMAVGGSAATIARAGAAAETGMLAFEYELARQLAAATRRADGS